MEKKKVMAPQPPPAAAVWWLGEGAECQAGRDFGEGVEWVVGRGGVRAGPWGRGQEEAE